MDDLADGLDSPVPAVEAQLGLNVVTARGSYILKLPPTKNWRPMIAAVLEGFAQNLAGLRAGCLYCGEVSLMSLVVGFRYQRGASPRVG